jgi:short-subunit dehydrogenase
MLYQALSIEHPDIRFSAVLPGSVEGDFFAGAVDGPGRVPESTREVLGKAEVAKACVNAADKGPRNVYIPSYTRSV